ncbi:secretin N-terminal domain-containing protein [Deinococcus apachensis]|uniref:secretin N-terminal domain-containing protein n=1 Tax=Deinococcus apachensis TaxID=309886 RepID=UPI000363AD17|nr:secretin N-terminal domain-containing protein [Deinococcus apachensis]
MKRYALLLSAALGMAAAQTTKPISPSTIPAMPSASGAATTTARLADTGLTSANVTFDLRRSGSDLSSMLVALAKSAGYDIILEPDVDSLLQAGSTAAAGAAGGSTAGTRVTYNFVNRPFNEVWPLVLDIYGLSYETLRLGDKPVLRVSAKPIQKIVTLPKALSAALVERQLKLSFGSVKTVSNQSSSNTAQGTNTSTTETAREEIILDSPTMRIVAEPSSNSIIIRGTNQEVAQVERLLSQIVAAQPPALQAPAPVTPPQDVQRIYTVKGAQADVTALLTAQYPGLKVTPVGQTGRVVLTGPQVQIDAAMGLLGQVDLPAPAAATPPSVSTGRSIYTVKGQQADISALLGAQYPDLKVTPVGQTGQLILNGPQTQLDAALSLLGQVDRPAPSPQATVQRVFQLVNASAEEVKATLEGTLARDLTPATPPLANVPVNATDANGNAVTVTVPTTQTSAAGSSADAQAKQATQTAAQNTGGATIIADKRTNSLIVRGTLGQVTQIGELIPQLDQVVPQINVQVRIQEITETAARSLGVDWKIGFGGFNVSMGGGGLGASFDPTRSLVGFNIFPTLTALENQGLTKRVYDGNITMQSGQRSLGTGTSAQNASSNAAASIKSGGRLEINIPSSSGNITRQIDYGLNLDFFDPQVAPDGTVTLRVRGQVNNIAGELPTNSVPNLLNFTNSEAQSSITFKNGQTVLMSGLLGTTESKTNSGVPFLSSLPVIGAAFGKQTTNRTQTQLLVIITGSVVK